MWGFQGDDKQHVGEVFTHYRTVRSTVQYAVPYSRLFQAILHYFKLFYTILNDFGLCQAISKIFCENSNSDEKHYLPNFNVCLFKASIL